MIFETEKEYCDFLVGELERSGYSVFQEVPFFSGLVDIVAYHKERVIAIEVKLRDYKRALRQARKHILFADEVYVAMPQKRAIYLDWNLADNLGIGLMSIGEDVQILHKSKPKIRPLTRYANQVLQHCSKHVSKYK